VQGIKLLEGEPLLYKGLIWVVKGYQHPPGYAVAFPRYNPVTRTKIAASDYGKYAELVQYWDCLKIEVPVVKVSEAVLYQPRLDPRLEEVVAAVRDLVGFENYVVTGSALIGGGNDLDIVVYGFREEHRKNLEKLVETDVFKRSEWVLLSEYAAKHASSIDFATYTAIKKNTLLHFTYSGVHVNMRPVKHANGFSECVDPVYKRWFFAGEVRVVELVENLVIPSKYVVEYRDSELYLETYRELYAELPRGVYYVEGFLESRRSGVYIVPDQGRVVKKD